MVFKFTLGRQLSCFSLLKFVIALRILGNLLGLDNIRFIEICKGFLIKSNLISKRRNKRFVSLKPSERLAGDLFYQVSRYPLRGPVITLYVTAKHASYRDRMVGVSVVAIE